MCLSWMDVIGRKIDRACRWYTVHLLKSYQFLKSLNYNWVVFSKTHLDFLCDHFYFLQLNDRSLEFTIWDYDRLEPNEFLGEVVIDMHDACLDRLAHWYPLNIHNYETPLPSPTPMTSPRGSFKEAQRDRGIY